MLPSFGSYKVDSVTAKYVARFEQDLNFENPLSTTQTTPISQIAFDITMQDRFYSIDGGSDAQMAVNLFNSGIQNLSH